MERLSDLSSEFPLNHTVRKIKEDHVGLKLNGTYRSLVYADCVNLQYESLNTTKRNTEALLVTNDDVGQKVM